MEFFISPGAVDQSIQLRALDSTTFLPYTSIAYNTAGIDMWYQREGAAKTSITEATLAALTTAHSDGGIIHKADGWFRLDLPDAAVAAGVDRVYVGGTATGVVMGGATIHLNFVTPAGIQSEVDDALVGRGLHKLLSSAVTGADVADDSVVAKLVSKSATADWDTYDNTTDALEANRDNIGTTGAAMTIAAVTGAVGSVTGNVGGNVAGSVASVTGAVGSVTGLTASDVGAIKTKTDQLTFTVAGEVDANTKSMNDTAVTGTGVEGDLWRG